MRHRNCGSTHHIYPARLMNIKLEKNRVLQFEEGNFMKPTVGLWIDHKNAVIVSMTGEEEKIKLIQSDLEKPQQSPTDDVRQRQWTEHLNHYYDKVISSLRNVEAILIMGPGEAKGELKKRMERTTLNRGKIDVETVDQMTEHQIVAKVRAHFQPNSQ